MSIFSRLMMGYLFLLVVATSMSVYTIIQLVRVRDVTHSIILEDNSLLDLHKSLTDALLSETRYEKKFIVLNDAALLEGFLAARRDFEKDLASAASISDTAELDGVLVKIGHQHASYQDLFSEERDLLQRGAAYDAGRYSAGKEEAVNAVLAGLQDVRAVAQRSIIRKITNLNEAGVSASNFAMQVTAASLVLGVLISILITRSITVPLARIRKRTAEIGSGVYGEELRLASPPEIGALARAFNFMSAKLREVDRMKSDFFALMSHELRTPLTSIKEGTNLLLDGTGGVVSDRQRRILSIIGEESNRLIELVNSLLDLSKLEAGMLAYHMTTTDLAPLISQAAGEIIPLAEAKRIRIERDVTPIPSVRADSERILQVLRNLVGNALKFTSAGGVIRISAVRRSDGVTVAVRDTGPGIPKEHQTAIFDKFQQAGTVRAGAAAGTGLGLAIVKHIIEDHGGTVWVESEEGKGATFAFVLPA